MFDLIPILACDPATILGASLAISAGSSVLKYQSARITAKAIEADERRTGALMVDQSAANVGDLTVRKAEMAEATQKQQQLIAKKSDIAQATARVSAGESGIGGATVEQINNEYLQTEAQAFNAAALELDSATASIDREMTRLGLATQARLASNFKPINQPSVGAAVLDFGGNAIKSYGTYKAGGYGEIT